ncbi:MAG: amidase family protein [Pseudomonadota bacterium]
MSLADAQRHNAFLKVFDPPLCEVHEGPLTGIRASVKDNVSLAGYPTTGASPACAQVTLPENKSVTRLKAAGASIVGKTNLHELAFGITGANAHTGDTLNAVDSRYLAGGSSAGAAVVVALDACDVAIGTDTGGSCRIPAAHNGIVGYRPSIDRYDGGGILTLSKTRDTLGLLAKDIATLAQVDAVMVDTALALTPSTPGDVTLGIVAPTTFFPIVDPHVIAAYEAALAALKTAGFNVQNVDLALAMEAHDACGFAIAVYETAEAMAALAQSQLGQSLADFASHIASDDVRGLIEMQIDEGAVPKAAYDEAISVHLPKLRQVFADALSRVDVLVYPTTPVGPVLQGTGELMDVGAESVPVFPATTAMSGPDSTAGQPSITLPCGTAGGLPVGLMLVGAIGQDEALINIAAAAEAILNNNKETFPS